MKKIIGVVLCLVMMSGILTACQNSNNEVATTGKNTTTAVQNETQGGAQASDTEGMGEIETINLYTFNMGTASDYKKIEDAVNAITCDKIGVEINLTMLDIGQWFGQYSMLISGSEQIDLMPSFYDMFTGGVNSGGFLALDELYELYGSDIESVMGRYVDVGYIGGTLYGLPVAKDAGTYRCIMYNADIVKELNLNVDNVRSLDDWEPILAAVKEAYPTTYPLYVQSSTQSLTSSYNNWDMLGDNLGVIMYDGDPTKIVNVYESEEYKELCLLLRDWNQKGYISSDSATSLDIYPTLAAAGQTFSALFHANVGTEAEFSASSGTRQKVIALGEPRATTTLASTILWGIPSTSEHSEAAMRFLNLMYVDKEVTTLLCYGIEGQDYQILPDGTAGFLDGQDATTVAYHPDQDWTWPNHYLATEWEGTEPDLGEKMMAFNASMEKSPAFGFRFDSTSVQNEMTACANVQKEYAYALECGSVDVESTLKAFNAALKSAGIDTIIAEKQRQLDAWLALQ